MLGTGSLDIVKDENSYEKNYPRDHYQLPLDKTGIIDFILTKFRKRDFENKNPFYNIQYHKFL